MQNRHSFRPVAAAALLVLSMLLGVWWSTRHGARTADGGRAPLATSETRARDGVTAPAGAGAIVAAVQPVGGAAEAVRAAGIELHAAPPDLMLHGDTAVYAEAPAHPTSPELRSPPPLHVDPSVRGSGSAEWTGAPVASQ